MPTIVLGQEEVDCFAAWVSIEAGLPECDDPTTEIKVLWQYIIIVFSMYIYVKMNIVTDKLWKITFGSLARVLDASP